MTTSIRLRPYQSEALKALDAAHEQLQRTVLSLPTGTGKTLVAALYAKTHFLDRGLPVLWIAHSEELLDQAHDTFALALGTAGAKICRLYAGKERLVDKPDAQLWLVNNLTQIGPASVALIVIDEAHHAPSRTYTEWMSAHQSYSKRGAKVIGLTATPYRLADGEVTSLLDFGFSRPKVPVFESIAYKRSFCELAALGHVAPFHHVRFDTGMSFKVKVQSGDISGETLELLDSPERNRFIFDKWKEHRDEYGKTLIFVGRKEHARNLARLFGTEGDYVVSGEGSEARRDVVASFREGKISVLVNVGLFKEGVDVPGIKTVILARPTMSPMLFMQMVGRGSRILPGKRFFYLVDIHDQLGKYEPYLAGVADLADRDSRLIDVVARKAEAVEKLAKSEGRSLVDDPSVLADLMAVPSERIVSEFAGWISFEDSAGSPAPVGALLAEDEYRALEQAADPEGRLPPGAAPAVRRVVGDSDALARCTLALVQGLQGRLRRFSLIGAEGLGDLKADAATAFPLPAGQQLSDLRTFTQQLASVARSWGVTELNIGRCLDEYRNSAGSFAAAISLRDEKGTVLRLVSGTVLAILREALEEKAAGRLGFERAPEVLAKLEQAEPGLGAHGAAILGAISLSSSIGDFCVVSGGGTGPRQAG